MKPISRPSPNGAEHPKDDLTLSVRQRQVIELIANGLSDKEIAVRLKISEETVATHLKRLYLHLAVHSRAALVAKVDHANKLSGVPRTWDSPASGQNGKRSP